MKNVLILLAVSEDIRNIYANKLTAAFPDLNVQTVDHHSKAGPYLGSTDILMTFGTLVSPQLLQGLTQLKWIQSLGTGMDGIADQLALRDDVVLTRIHGIVDPVSETVIGAMLALSRDMRRSFENQAKQVWERYTSRLLTRKTVGILGVGVIAEALAPKCKALGMRVVGLSSAPRALPGFDEIVPVGELKSAVQTFDYLVVLTPYSRATHHLVDEAVLAAMKPGSYIINVARGDVIDETALIDALNNDRIAGAALDVFHEEPLPKGHPFWSMRNVIVTPHSGGLCDVYPDLAMPTVLENMGHFLTGDIGKMINRVTKSEPQ